MLNLHESRQIPPHSPTPPSRVGTSSLGRAMTALSREIRAATRSSDGSPRRVAVGLGPIERGALAAAFLGTPDPIPATCFASRDGSTELYGLGASCATSAGGVRNAPEGWRFYGGPAFGASAEAPCFEAPIIEAAIVRGEATLAAYLVGAPEHAQDKALELLELLATGARSDTVDASDPTLVDRAETPGLDAWRRGIDRALGAIRAGELAKVVLARQVALRFSQRICPIALLAALSAREPRSFRFARRVGGVTWVGASPERLYSRQGRRVVSEALAGTRHALGEEARRRAGSELLESDKDRREHALVVHGVVEALAPLAIAGAGPRGELVGVGAADTPTLLETSRLLHLWTPIHATLRPEVTDGQLIAALQPTPATCGTPREAASALLAELEPFARGPFAAPIGWISRHEAELAVGLRAAEVAGERVILTAGAGIVEGSEADAEWREIDAKMEGLLAALELLP